MSWKTAFLRRPKARAHSCRGGNRRSFRIDSDVRVVHVSRFSSVRTSFPVETRWKQAIGRGGTNDREKNESGGPVRRWVVGKNTITIFDRGAGAAIPRAAAGLAFDKKDLARQLTGKARVASQLPRRACAPQEWGRARFRGTTIRFDLPVFRAGMRGKPPVEGRQADHCAAGRTPRQDRVTPSASGATQRS